MDSAEFRAHCIRVVNGIDSITNTAVDSDVLQEQLEHLGMQHAKIPGIKGDYFPVSKMLVYLIFYGVLKFFVCFFLLVSSANTANFGE